jgi:hypothetical protein
LPPPPLPPPPPSPPLQKPFVQKVATAHCWQRAPLRPQN